ncbi:MAG: hypothetical protein V7719_08300 [Psychroserpens sp.]|uniref:hypothetical protein n=1 Tax=Psychroserpens sp. TaxID=2020870 RepID=UPI0030026D91
MTEQESPFENPTLDKKLHSSKAIGGATFLGGPLAAGYLIQENFNALDKPTEGRNSLIIGIIATIVLFGGIFMIPESIIDKMPKQLIPLIYTGIIWGIVEWMQGDALKSHKEHGNAFFSGWRAAGVGFVALLILAAGIFGYAYMEGSNPAYDIYDEKIAEFSKNETESLTFFNHIETKDDLLLLNELNHKVLPKWDENIKIMQDLITLEGLPSDVMEQSKNLLEYSQLRFEAFQLIKKIIKEDTEKYDSQLNMLNLKIDNLLNKLNES